MQLSSWGWAQSCSKHIEDSNKHIIEEIVRQVGHLPEGMSILPDMQHGEYMNMAD
jgi:hypothetical protein